MISYPYCITGKLFETGRISHIIPDSPCTWEPYVNSVIILNTVTPLTNTTVTLKPNNIIFNFFAKVSELTITMANSVDPDQTAPRSSLIRVYTVCAGSSVTILTVITVCLNILLIYIFNNSWKMCPSNRKITLAPKKYHTKSEKFVFLNYTSQKIVFMN